MNTEPELKSAVQTIKQAILQSQSRAVKMISGTQLSLYFGVVCMCRQTRARELGELVQSRKSASSCKENFLDCGDFQKKASRKCVYSLNFGVSI